MEVFETAGRPVKAWVDGVEFDAGARRQVENIAALPFVHDHIAVMPDVHLGKGATVLDEAPSAYKDIGAVMAAQHDLVRIVHTLRQVVCIKG
ncbi:MAG TPA: RtcB family protein [Candidatus Elarobacter sp.]